MADIKVPVFPESVEEGSIAAWRIQIGESFQRDEILVDIETDKVVLEVPALAAGILVKIITQAGETVRANQIIGQYDEGQESREKKTEQPLETAAAMKREPTEARTVTKEPPVQTSVPAAKEEARMVTKEPPIQTVLPEEQAEEAARTVTKELPVQTSVPAAKEAATQSPPLNASSLAARTERTGPAARRFAQERSSQSGQPLSTGTSAVRLPEGVQERVQKRVPMTRLRASVAKRLVESQRTAAILTTFNEVNMQPVMELRAKYKDEFERKNDGVRLGFMSFFIKAVCDSLYKFPEVNAHIDDNDIVYSNYQDIGVAVSSPRGLVVPIVQNAQAMDMATIEKSIRAFSEKAKDAKLTIEELQGGTFTISNGGVFGSLMSTPIINPPQTAILGMHKIQERPVAVNKEVVILPMMYLALSYDHRMIDGKTAVQFLVNVKNFLEYPGLTLLGV